MFCKSIFYMTTLWIQYSSSHHYDYQEAYYDDKELPRQQDYYQPQHEASAQEGVDDNMDYENYYSRSRHREKEHISTGGGIFPDDESSFAYYAQSERPDCKCYDKKCTNNEPISSCDSFCETLLETQDNDVANVPNVPNVPKDPEMEKQNNVVLVPYPYPVVLHLAQPGLIPFNIPLKPENIFNSTTTDETEQTTTSTSEPTSITEKEPMTTEIPTTTKASTNETTTSKPIPISRKNNYEHKHNNIVRLKEIKNINNFAITKVRPLKQNRLTRYGLVQIPDSLATKLMLQMRNMKNIQHRRPRNYERRDYN